MLPALFATVAAQTWFARGKALAGGDVPPPVAPGSDYRLLWSQFADPEGRPSFDIVGLPYYEGLRVAHSLGLGEVMFQRLWLTALFAGCSLAVVFFSFSLAAHPVTAGVAGIFGAFNASRFVLPAEAAPLAATIAAALLGGLLIRAGLRGGGMRRAIPFALASVLVEFLLVNPAYVYLLVLWIALIMVVLTMVGGRNAGVSAVAMLVRAAPLIVVVNAWWLAPAVMTLLDPVFWHRFAASPVDAWTWTHRRASLGNVLTLNTAWNWNNPTYYPYASQYGDVFHRVIQYALPVLGASGIALTRGPARRIAVALAVTALPLVLVGKGVHPPFGEANRWLYDHLPGFWVVREPSKTLVFLSIPLSVLAGLGFTELVRRRSRSTLARPVVGFGLLLAAVAYVHPLFTGEMYGHTRLALTPSRVGLPAGWREAAAVLNSQPPEGKVLVLPRSPFYQVPTTWGYWGGPFANLLIHDRGVFQAQPGGSLSPPAASVEVTSAQVERELVQGDRRAVLDHLRLLGVHYLLLRRDLRRGTLGRTFEDPESIALGLSRTPGIGFMGRWGQIALYRVQTAPKEVFAARPVGYRGPTQWLPDALTLNSDSALVALEHDSRGALHKPAAIGLYHSEQGSWLARGVLRDGNFTLTLTNPVRAQLASSGFRGLATQTLRFARVRLPFVLTIGRTAFDIRTTVRGQVGLGFVPVPSNTEVSIWRNEGDPRPIPLGSASRLSDCDKRGGRDPQLGANVTGPPGADVLRLAASSDSACVFFSVAPSEPPAPYGLGFDYRAVRGEPPRACLWQEGVDRCSPTLALRPAHRRWRRLEQLVMPEAGSVRLRLFLYADGSGGVRTVAAYRRITIQRYRRLATRSLRISELARVGTLSAGAAIPDVQAPRALGGLISLRTTPSASDCARFGNRSLRQLGISARVLRADGRRVLRLTARGDVGCASFPVVLDPGASYRVRLSYRRVRGQGPSLCLWQVGPERCALLPALDDSPGWHRLSTSVTPEPGTVALRLFLYADARLDAPTTSDYRTLSVTPLLAIALLESPAEIPLPVVTYRRLGADRFRARVQGARAAFLLVADETYSPGWHVEGPRRPGRSEHLTVNGYANGWLVPWKGTYDLTIAYSPERYATIAGWIGIIVSTIVVGTLLGVAVGRLLPARPRLAAPGDSVSAARP